MNRISALLPVLAAIVAMATVCAKETPNPADSGPTQLRFRNMLEKQRLSGGSEQYLVRNLSTLGAQWSGEVEFGEYSSYQTVEARSVDFTVLGEIRPSQGGTWVPSQWTKRTAMRAGSQSTVDLTFGE